MGFLRIVQTFSILVSSFLVDRVYNLEEGSSYFFYQRPVYPRDCHEVLEQCTTHSASGVYLIRPDGYDEAFEVYCDHQVDGGGWTVLLRRNDNNSAEFRRTFSEYSEGFGFLGSEFWLGNRRLSFLTNQKRYELRIDMVNSAGSSFYISYDLFRISDEWSSYKLISTGQYSGTADNFITQCPTTISPSGDCASPVPSQPTDCYDIFTSGITEDGVYTIQPTGWTEPPFDVYCNMSHDGGWTVFQRRVNGSVDFQFREWEAYKEGFGFPSHELWLGNEKLFLLTNQKNYKLRVDYVDRDGVPYYMNYDLFRVGDETTNYQLELLGAFTGNSGYDYMGYHRGRPFTTRDRDNDAASANCAEDSRGGWWYDHCYNANLNGDYSESGPNGVALYRGDTGFFTYSLRYTQMKIRPV